MIWTTTHAGTYLVGIRADLDLQAGTALEYDGTPDGAYTLAGALLAARIDQGVALAVSNLFLATAEEPVLIATALDASLAPREGTYSRYTVRVACTGTVEIPEGTRVRGGGTLGRSTWAVITPTANYQNDDEIEIEAEDLGPISIADDTTLSLITTISGVSGLTYDAGDSDPFQLGRDAETPAELRARIIGRQAARTGSAAAIRSALLEIPWVVAVDVRRPAAGQVAITVAPAPVGTDQEDELGAAIYAAIPAEAETTGTETLTITDANGQPDTVAYTPGTTEAVAVYASLTGDGTVPNAEMIAAATAAIREVFSALGNGEPVTRLQVIGALVLPGVFATPLVTLNGTTGVSVSPSNVANVLVPSPLTVVIA